MVSGARTKRNPSGPLPPEPRIIPETLEEEDDDVIEEVMKVVEETGANTRMVPLVPMEVVRKEARNNTLARRGNRTHTGPGNVDRNKKRTETSPGVSNINAGGDMFAYAVGYDWSKGHEFYNAASKNHIFLHSHFLASTLNFPYPLCY